MPICIGRYGEGGETLAPAAREAGANRGGLAQNSRGPALDAGGAGKQSTERKAGSRVRCAVGVVRFEQLAGGLVARPTGLKLGLSDGYCYRRGSAEPARQ